MAIDYIYDDLYFSLTLFHAIFRYEEQGDMLSDVTLRCGAMPLERLLASAF